MRFVALLLLLTTLYSGCSSSEEKMLVGQWVSEHPEELFNGVADGEELGEMTIQFHANGKLETITDFPMAQGHKSGTWSLVEYDKARKVATVIFTITNPEEIETKVKFLDDDRIKLVPPNIAVLETEFIFRRKP